MKMFSRFNPPVDPGITFKGETLTQEHMANECDLNQIMEKAKRGIVPSAFFQQKTPWFGDFSDGLTFHDIKNVLIDTEKAFMELDPKIRERFNNNPAALVDFLEDEGNREEAERLNLIPKAAEAAKTDESEVPAGSSK